MLNDAQKAASRVFADAMIGYAIKRLEERVRSAEDNGLEFTAPTARRAKELHNAKEANVKPQNN